MAALTRPYLITMNGTTRMVDAKDPGAVVRHVVGAAVSELRPARAAEVATWARDGKKIETAGTAGVPAAAGDDARPGWDADDATAWLKDRDHTGLAVSIWLDAVEVKHLTLEDVDIIRSYVPDFATVVAHDWNDDGVPNTGNGKPLEIEQIRGELEEHPLPINVAIERIGQVKRAELFEPVGLGEPDQSEADRTGESLG